MKFLGWASLCFPARDLELSKRYYLASGMTMVAETPGKRVVLASGNFRLALLPFLDRPLLNVRAGVVRLLRQPGARETCEKAISDGVPSDRFKAIISSILESIPRA